MRYYRIEIANLFEMEIGDDKEKDRQIQIGHKPIAIFSSHLDNSQMNTGALNIVMNLSMCYYHQSQLGTSFVQIQGIPLQTLMQANDLRGKYIRIWGGMTKGYIVENDNYGVLLEGIICGPYGNWVGTNQTISFFIGPTKLVIDPDIVFSWKRGQSLRDAIRATLKNTFPHEKIEIDISQDFQCLLDQGGVYNNLQEFSTALSNFCKSNRKSKPINIYEAGGTLYATDNRFGRKIRLKPYELVGQPTWSDNNDITVTLLMRADISLNDIINFPDEVSYYGIIQPIDNATDLLFNRGKNSSQKNNVIFHGDFLVTSLQHVGNYKSPSPNEWITILTVSAMDNALVKSPAPKINGLS